jgi:predicted amidohydrolase
MPSQTLSIAAIQMQSGQDLAQNLASARTLCARAARGGAALVALPENFAFFGPEEERRAHAEAVGAGPISHAVAEMARDSGVFVVAGGMPERSSDPRRPHNTAAVFDTKGDVVTCYRKLHLFDVELPNGQVYAESASTTAGEEAVLFECNGVRVGLAICYDLRFSALFSALASASADMFCVTAAFTESTGMAHWATLLRARAIEHTTYVAAAAQWGSHPGGRRTYGHSSVIDPWGTVLAQHGEGEGIVSAVLDLGYQASVRARLPCLAHRRTVSSTRG